MKKNVYFLLALLLMVLSACDNEPKFKVSGEISGADNKTLYFEASGLDGIVALDSAKLGSNGVFSFSGKRPESPEFYRLRLDNKVINFSVDSIETLTVKAGANDFATGYSIEGSENNTKIKELVLLLADLQKRVDQLAHNRNIPAGVAQDSLVSMVNNYKNKVKREYIFAAPNMTYAYFALFQALNGYMLFDPLTNKDDVKCFAAVATSLNNTYPHADRSRNLYNMVIKGMKNTRTPRQTELDIPQDKIKEATIIDIELKDIKGNVRRLTDLKGKVILIDFTVYNNAMSAAHNLALRELYNKYASQGLEIYQISLDADEHFWKTSSDNLPWICVRDANGAHYMAGGHVEKVVHALVSASKANIELSFQMATGIDLAGRDVFEAVQMSVNPKVIDTPPVTAVAKDGIQLIAKARVTVRANIRQLVGGAGEDTILARVGEGIVSSIGSSENHKSVLENPDSISKLVLRKGLDAGTAFEILSIDIADIDIGRNIGAALQIDQANADKNIAQAKAEERRAMAVALEQEMKAKAEEARANVIQAEAEVPKAMAEAFRSGNLGIMDYYRMKNIQADTSMRENIAKPETSFGNEPLSK